MLNVTLEFRGIPVPSSVDEIHQLIEDIESGKYPGLHNSRHDLNIQTYLGAMKDLWNLRNTFKISEVDEMTIISIREKMREICQLLAERYIDNEDKKSRDTRIEALLEDDADKELKKKMIEDSKKSFERVIKKLSSE